MPHAFIHRVWLAALALTAGMPFAPPAVVGQDFALYPTPGSDPPKSFFETGFEPTAIVADKPDNKAFEPGYAQPASHLVETDQGPNTTEGLAKRVAELEKALKKQEKPGDGWTDLSDEKWTVKLGGHVQLDYINWPHADPAIAAAQNYFEFRRLRLTADGKGYGVFDFRLQMTLEPGSGPLNATASPDVKDAYLSMNEIPLVGRLRVGNFFVPFGLEQVTNDTFNIFLERSIPTQGIFTADREVGVGFYNCTEEKNVTWSGGCFFDSLNDTLKTRLDNNQGYRLSGRVTWLPYYDEPSSGRYLVHTGAGVLYTDDQDRSVRFLARPQIRSGPAILDTGPIASRSYTVGNLEFATVMGSFTMQSEVFATSIQRGAAEDINLFGAYVHLSYFLTGETRLYERFGQHGANFGRNVPFTNFFIVPGGWGSGAWEAKARWSHLEFETLGRGQYNDLTVGFNWYWSDRTRVMFDWIHPQTTAAAQPFGATTSDIIGMRFDFNW